MTRLMLVLIRTQTHLVDHLACRLSKIRARLVVEADAQNIWPASVYPFQSNLTQLLVRLCQQWKKNKDSFSCWPNNHASFFDTAFRVHGHGELKSSLILPLNAGWIAYYITFRAFLMRCSTGSVFNPFTNHQIKGFVWNLFSTRPTIINPYDFLQMNSLQCLYFKTSQCFMNQLVAHSLSGSSLVSNLVLMHQVIKLWMDGQAASGGQCSLNIPPMSSVLR